ncbi:MAG: M48 family metalloprotease [Candidatus Dependentiae bacterium]
MFTFIKQLRKVSAVWLYFFSLVLIMLVGISFSKDFLEEQALIDAIQTAQITFGSMPLHAEQEQFIRSIADEIGVTRKLIIRKMNQNTLVQFGYHNAFAYSPQMFFLFPLKSVSFLFVSEGFFEDLTPEEQRFLIGHEMIHISHGHLDYLTLCVLLLFILLAFFSWQLKKRMQLIVRSKVSHRYQMYMMSFVTFVLFCACSVGSSGAALAYRRYIEKEADCVSMQLLNSYDGCMQLTERLHKECKLALHNPYFGLTSDHPSCSERQAYCLELQNIFNQKDLS